MTTKEGLCNQDIIRASSELSGRPIIVWFPTLHAEKFLRSQKFEIPEEWVDLKMRRKLKLRLTEGIKPLSIFSGNKAISEEAKGVLRAIKENNAILATGDISWET